MVYKVLLLLLPSCFSHARPCATPETAVHLSLGRLPCPWDSPSNNTGVDCHLLLQCIKVKSESEVAQSCPTLCDPIDGSPPGSPIPDSPGKNTGVGCHFLLQSVKVKNESEVAQLCPTLCDPMDCSLPGPSIHGIFQATVLEWVAMSFPSSEFLA